MPSKPLGKTLILTGSQKTTKVRTILRSLGGKVVVCPLNRNR